MGADWPNKKGKTNFGTLPILMVDGEEFSQGLAIQTFLARKCDLFGKTLLEGLKIDEISHLREDMLIPETKHFLESDETKKSELSKQLLDEHYPKFLGFFDSVMKKNTEKNKSNWAVGTKMSLADLVIYEGTTTVSRNCPDLFKKYPVFGQAQTN